MLADSEESPPDVKKKFEFLQRHDVPRRILGHQPSLVDFSKRLGISREALRDQLVRRNLPSEIQSTLARKLRFRLDWPEWSAGTAAEFEACYLKEHNPAPPPTSNKRLRKGSPIAPERCNIQGLAAIEIFAAQFNRGSAAVGFELSCGKAFLHGVPITIRFGEVTWDCGGGQLDTTTRQGRDAPYPVGDDVKLEWNGADSFHPAWRVETSGSCLGNVDVPPDFARIVGLSPGSTITVKFGVWQPDLEEDQQTAANALLAAVDAIDVLDANTLDDMAKLSTLKKRILIRLGTEALERRGDFIVLARHRMTFAADE